MTDTKTVNYAFPSSEMALEFDCAKSGCYYITFEILSPKEHATYGPFKTARSAEVAAERHHPELSWSWMYVANPFPGSQFEQAAKFNKAL